MRKIKLGQILIQNKYIIFFIFSKTVNGRQNEP